MTTKRLSRVTRALVGAVVSASLLAALALAFGVTRHTPGNPNPNPDGHQRQPRPWEPLRLPASWNTFLSTGHWDTTATSFRIIALSFMADGCVAAARRDPSLQPAAQACVARVLALAEATRPQGAALEGLWLSHWALILGAADQLGPCPRAAQHAAVAQTLAQASLHAPHHHVPSYAHDAHRWPADQTVLFAALARFDRAHGQHVADEPWQAFKRELLEHALDPATGLPWSEITGRGRGAGGHIPRGCALTYQTRFVAEIDPALAHDWWQLTKRHYLLDRALLVGFREWPAGRELSEDVDSGPIVADVGSAATAFGLIAAKVEGDALLAARLGATLSAGAALAEQRPAWRRLAHSLLTESIRFLGETLVASEPAR